MDINTRTRSAFTNPQVRAAVEFTNETATMLGVPQERVQIMRDAETNDLHRAMRRHADDELNGTVLVAIGPAPADAYARLAVAALVLRERELA